MDCSRMKTTTTFNFSQQNANKNQFSTQNVTLKFPVGHGIQDDYLNIIILATISFFLSIASAQVQFSGPDSRLMLEL